MKRTLKVESTSKTLNKKESKTDSKAISNGDIIDFIKEYRNLDDEELKNSICIDMMWITFNDENRKVLSAIATYNTMLPNLKL
jgi:hypothetical protein